MEKSILDKHLKDITQKYILKADDDPKEDQNKVKCKNLEYLDANGKTEELNLLQVLTKDFKELEIFYEEGQSLPTKEIGQAKYVQFIYFSAEELEKRKKPHNFENWLRE